MFTCEHVAMKYVETDVETLTISYIRCPMSFSKIALQGLVTRDGVRGIKGNLQNLQCLEPFQNVLVQRLGLYILCVKVALQIAGYLLCKMKPTRRCRLAFSER